MLRKKSERMRKLEFFVTRDFEVNVRNVLDFFAADRAQVSSFSILAQRDDSKTTLRNSDALKRHLGKKIEQ